MSGHVITLQNVELYHRSHGHAVRQLRIILRLFIGNTFVPKLQVSLFTPVIFQIACGKSWPIVMSFGLHLCCNESVAIVISQKYYGIIVILSKIILFRAFTCNVWGCSCVVSVYVPYNRIEHSTRIHLYV